MLRACLLLLVLCLASLPVQAESLLIALVRHAEKVDESRDPALSAAGEARAGALAEALAGTGIQAIYSTDFRRTRATAAPLATRMGVPVQIYARPGEANADATIFAASLLSRHGGQAVLVVGHSNTVPALVEALTGQVVAPLSDDDYDRLYLVWRDPSGQTRLVQSRYAEPSVPAP